MQEQDRLFTLEEALELIPLVRQLLIEIQDRKRDLDERTGVLDDLMGRTSGNGHLAGQVAEARKAIEGAGEALQQLMAELEATGAELKGIEQGLVDFRSLREGRVVYLCWRLGEDTITWWHELDTGFGGRQPL